MSRPFATGKSALIREALLERYPDKVAETGFQAGIASEFGVTRELVRQVALSVGVKRVRKVRMVRACASCGKCGLAGGKSMYCSGCVKIPLACDECGKIRYDRADWVLRKFDDAYNERRRAAGVPAYAGKMFCSRQCSRSYHGKRYGWGNPNHPIHAHQGEHGRYTQYTQGCRCEECKRAASEYQRERYWSNPEYRESIRRAARERYARLKAERA